MNKFKAPFSASLKNFYPLKRYFIQYRWSLALGLLCLLLVDFFQLLIPLVIKKAIDLLTTETVTAGILFKQGIMILAIALGIVLLSFSFGMNLLFHFFQGRIRS